MQFNEKPLSVGQQIYIPQHPRGRPKEIAIADSEQNSGVCEIDTFNAEPVRYSCDTEGGSSGSPVIDATTNEAVALHRKGGRAGNSGYSTLSFLDDIRIFVPRGGESARRAMKSRWANRCVDLTGSDGRNVIAYGCHGKQNQQWTYDPVTKTIASPVDGMCLDVNRDNNNVIGWPCHGRSNQQWELDGEMIRSVSNPSHCLDMDRSNSSLIIWKCHGRKNQRFNWISA